MGGFGEQKQDACVTSVMNSSIGCGPEVTSHNICQHAQEESMQHKLAVVVKVSLQKHVNDVFTYLCNTVCEERNAGKGQRLYSAFRTVWQFDVVHVLQSSTG